MTTPTTVQVRLQIRADTAANWTSVNPILLANELGLETDTKKFKVGDGTTVWNSLAYFPSIVSGGTVLGNLEIGTTGTLTFEGSTANDFETTLGVVDPTADRTILLPDQSGTVVIGGNASITDADIAANAEIAVSKLANGTANQVLVTDGTDVSWSDNLTLAGDLTVNGTTTTVNTETLTVKDKNIDLAVVDTPTDVTADGGGITLKGTTDKTINWIDATDAWTSSERFSVPLGSAAAPSLTFTGDENTGIYSPGADQLALSTNSSGRIHIGSTGTVNIVGAGTAGSTQAVSFNGSAPVNSVVLDSSGRLGIGTSSVGAVLHSKGAGGSASGSELLRLETTQATGGNWISFYDASARKGYIGYKETTDDNLYIENEESGNVVIPGSTRLGIGTSTPNANNKVDIAGSLLLSGSDNSINLTNGTGVSDSGNGAIRVRGQSGASPSMILGVPSSGYWAFEQNGSEKARLDSSGRLLVGTSSASATGHKVEIDNGSSPYGLLCYTSGDSQESSFRTFRNSPGTSSIKLEFARGTKASPSVVQSGDRLGFLGFTGYDGSNFQSAASIDAYVDGTPGANDMPGRLVFSTTADGASSPTERMRISNNGDSYFLGNSSTISVSNTQGAGTTYNLIYGVHSATTTTGTGTNCFVVRTNGNVQNTNNSYGALSDAKLKENIVDSASQWEDVKALQIRKYNFKEETGQQTHTQLGVVAQEVELVSPGLVTESPDRDAEGNDLGTVTKSVNYSVLYMKAVKALQEAMERIEQLETEMAAVKAQLS